MKVGSGSIEVKHVDLSPPFKIELGVIGLILIASVLFKLLWG